eukprot:Amastigsp_a841680_68.p2 type:complete len:233 gc:universal Amastigsp_a841680_68:1378-680(-)
MPKKRERARVYGDSRQSRVAAENRRLGVGLLVLVPDDAPKQWRRRKRAGGSIQPPHDCKPLGADHSQTRRRDRDDELGPGERRELWALDGERQHRRHGVERIVKFFRNHRPQRRQRRRQRRREGRQRRERKAAHGSDSGLRCRRFRRHRLCFRLRIQVAERKDRHRAAAACGRHREQSSQRIKAETVRRHRFPVPNTALEPLDRGTWFKRKDAHNLAVVRRRREERPVGREA